MADPYAAAIHLTAVNGVSPVLKTIMGGLLGIDVEVNKLEKQ